MSERNTEKRYASKTDAETDIRLEQARASDESIQQVHASLMRKKEEAPHGFPFLPMFVVFLFSALVFLGAVYMAAFGGQFDGSIFDERLKPYDLVATEPEELDIVALGEQVYGQTCRACHQAGGEGIPGAFPTLVDTDWVTGPEERLVRVVLYGLVGEIEVRGETYDGAMPGFGGQLNDQRAAAVMTYIRQAWGNDASEVSEETVADIRSEVGSRGPWTAGELEPYAD